MLLSLFSETCRLCVRYVLPTIFRKSPALVPDTLLATPSPSLVRAVRAAVTRWDRESVLRVEAPAAPADPLAWLDAQTGGPKTYWRGREDAEARASVGAALVVEADRLDALPDRLGDTVDRLPPNARLVTTARFDADAEVGAEWAPFGAVRFVLPRIEYRTDGTEAAVAVHLVPGDDVPAVLAEVAALREPDFEEPKALPLPFMRRDDPDRAEWDRMLRWTFGAFESGTLDKVVLARRARFLFETAVDPVGLLRRLEAATPRCFHALVAPASGPTFLTATPERLFRLGGRVLETEAVAGTRPRSEADGADDRLRAELLASEKDQREHAYVRTAIETALAPLAERVEVDAKASAMTLARGRHLRTGIRAALRPETGPLDVLRALHPTPAVGGTPRSAALDAIGRLEPFDRGLYAGVIGWIGRDAGGAEAAEVAVGIRSGLVDGTRLSLYSGAGIVAGSDPEAEWAEIEHKIGDFARVLGLTDRVEA